VLRVLSNNIGIVRIDVVNGLSFSYDIVGDIHGEYAALVVLLQKLGYDCKQGVWQHNDRKVVFLGDFIDRGSCQRQVIELVRSMIDGSR